jgi:site-specific recombinase XerC
MRGGDLKALQEILGHTTLAMTMKYAHLSSGHKMDAVQRLVKPKTKELTDTNTDTKRRTKEKGTQ